LDLTTYKHFLQKQTALDGVNGPDDLIAVAGDEAIRYVHELAQPATELAVAEVEAAIADIVAAKPNISADQMRRALDAVADASDHVQREMLESRLAAAVRGVMPKSTVVRQVKARRQERAARQEDFSRQNREAELRAVPVDAKRLIEELERFFADRAHLPQGAALVLAYFALNTWTFRLFDTVPYLLLESAVPGCGKSTVIRLLHTISCRSRKASSLSEAVMFRLIDTESPTLLIDEAETLDGRSERAEALRAVAHEG
jgi:DNA primase